MGFKLCTAEKPSVARDIAQVLGATTPKQGYYEGNGYLVTWAVGHLVSLAEPEAYGYLPKSRIYGEERDRAYAELPLIPENWQLSVIESVKDQFEIVRRLMHREDVDYIIDCGDMGAEGHILQWMIRQKAGCTKPVKRFCATSMTEEAIRSAMGALREADEFLPIIRGELCKKKADWMLGLSLSRAESLKYKTHINVGRVQSPTLAFVVARYLETVKFKPTNYYTLTASMDAGGQPFKVYWKADKAGILPTNVKDSAGRCVDKPTATRWADKVMAAGVGEVVSVSCQKRAADRPQLYDITELQRDANRRYGYSAALTLAAAQALYETQKVLTYPRTDSRYITSDLVSYLEQRVMGIGSIPKYADAATAVMAKGLNVDKKIVDDAKVADHHALLPTSKIQGFDPARMAPTKAEESKGLTSEILQNVLDLVLCRVLVSLSPAFTYEQTDVVIDFQREITFTASGKVPLDAGWKWIQTKLNGGREPEEPDTEKDEEQKLPLLQKGQRVAVCGVDVSPKKTTPPKLHTEATLLTEMENAGQKIEGGAILKGKGIGTQATRAEIIKGLFDTGVIETLKKGKTNYIKPTEKGMAVLRVLPPELYSAKITADWETKIARIAEGTMTEDQFLADFIKFLTEKTEQIKAAPAVDVAFFKAREVFAVCPWCGSAVYKWQEKSDNGKPVRTRYYCSHTEDGSCRLSIASDDMMLKSRLGRTLMAPEAKKLIEKGFLVAQCKRKADGVKYQGKFTLVKKEAQDKTGALRVYANIKFELPAKA